MIRLVLVMGLLMGVFPHFRDPPEGNGFVDGLSDELHSLRPGHFHLYLLSFLLLFFHVLLIVLSLVFFILLGVVFLLVHAAVGFFLVYGMCCLLNGRTRWTVWLPALLLGCVLHATVLEIKRPLHQFYLMFDKIPELTRTRTSLTGALLFLATKRNWVNYRYITVTGRNIMLSKSRPNSWISTHQR